MPAASTPWWTVWIGLPFGEPPSGLTCWELVRRVLAARAAIHLPAYGEIAAADLIRVARAFRDGAAVADTWRTVAEPRALDVVPMRAASGGGAIVHVGVMVDAERLLHVEAATASVVVPVTHWSVARRIAGYRRHACLC